MTAQRPVLTALALLCSLTASSSSSSSIRLEISSDGQLMADPALDQTSNARGEPIAIFNPAPDWQNTLRRQVGGLAADDLDGDGRPDLVAVCYQSNSFPAYDNWRNFIHFNSEDGLETAPSWISDDQVHSGDVKIADIDADGFPDLVVANGGSAYAANAIYFGTATGPETTPGWTDAQPAWTNAIAVVDIDGDGWLDIVSANQGRGSGDNYRPMFLFRNTGGVLETTPSWQSTEESIQNSVATADLDGDGDPDIATAQWVDFESAVYDNLDGTPDAVPAWTSGNTDTERGVALADFDGDGRIDLLLGVGDTLTLYTNNGDGTYTPTWSAGQTASHQDLLVADFDGDGRPDIVDIDFSTGRSHLFLNGPDGLDPTPAWSYDADASGTALAAADFDGDGRLDLAVGYSGEPSVVVFYNQIGPAADPEADLWLALTSEPASTSPGSSLDLLVDVGNLGPDAATDVVVTLTLPAAFNYALNGIRPLSGQQVNGIGWQCASAGTGQVECTLPGELAAESAASALQVTVDVDAEAGPGSVEVGAEVGASALDPDPENNTAVIDVDIVDKHDLIFADGFENAGKPTQCGWDTGLGTQGGALSSLGLWGDDLYVGPALAGPFGGVGNGVAKIDLATGTASSLATTELVDGYVNAFVPFDDGNGEKLYVLGAFNGIRFDGDELPGSRAVVTWDGTATTALASPFSADMAFAWTGTTFQGRLVLGGSVGFPQTPLLAITTEDGWRSWSSELEGLVAPIVMASAVYDGDLYIAGRFDRIRLPGDPDETVVESKNIMGFDGDHFFSVGGGVQRGSNPVSQVMALAVFDGALYLGGRFDQSATGMALHSVAKWDGTTLSPVGAGFPTPIDVRDLVVHDDGSGEALYALGTFTTDTDGTPIRRLARLEAGEWIELAGGVGENPGAGQSLPDGGLAIGGSFTDVGAKGVPGSGAGNGLAVYACNSTR